MGSHATREIASEDIPDATISLDNSSPGKDGKFHAVPVDIVQLVAHIIAFERTLEPLRTLTLCHLYGRGTSVSITKLPVELIDMIRDFFILDERAVQRELCEESFRCFTNVCSYFYHADDDQAYQAKWRLAKEHGWSRDFGHDCSNCWYSDHFTQDEVENMFCILENDYNDAWTDLEKILKAEYGKLIDGEHHCRANKWFKKVHIGSVRSVIPPAPSIDSVSQCIIKLYTRRQADRCRFSMYASVWK